MNNPFKFRWVIVICIWSIAIGLTYWNLGKINAVTFTRERAEQIRKEIAFKSQHAEPLKKIRKSYETLFYPVSSVALGLIAVDRQIREMASDNDLKNVDMRSQKDPTTEDQLSCELSIQGALEQVFQFMLQISKYPYLQIRHLNMQISPFDANTKTELKFVFQYRLLPSVETGGPVLQVSSEPSESGRDQL
jgi:Tfp pilus assembly protein PilO